MLRRPNRLGAGPPVAQRVAVSPAVHAAGPFTDGCDYQSAFAIERPDGQDLSAEQWARALFEDAARAMRWFLIVGWTVITCRLRPRHAASQVLGWHIECRCPETVVIMVRAWVGFTSHLVVSVDTATVTVASFVRSTGPARPVARAVWAATIPLHERILPYLLTSAIRRATQV